MPKAAKPVYYFTTLSLVEQTGSDDDKGMKRRIVYCEVISPPAKDIGAGTNVFTDWVALTAALQRWRSAK